MSDSYVGAPWRSRFLRAPKAAFELAKHEDFVRVDRVATARLGLKTGSDNFFYVHRLRKLNGARKPRRRGLVAVQGMGGTWEGNLSARDLIPAVLSPHQLIRNKVRAFVVPRTLDTFYLFPRGIRGKADLPDYVNSAEREGINGKPLVRANASEKKWYVQTRSLVRSRWVLPYNSAYDYGALDNDVGAILNGRFVGVEPLEGVDTDLLGAALNSTFFITSRLLEGTTTGVEGAFDAGPPAVRCMLIPDVRRMKKVDEVRDVIQEMRELDITPPAPARDKHVHPLRHRLDIALLVALGWTRGEASAVTGRVYESYARWRGAVEDVESAMRANRRSMARTGRNRTTRKEEVVAQRIWGDIERDVVLIPGGALKPEDELEMVDVPRNVRAPAQEPLFQPGLIIANDGSEVDLGSYQRVRYAEMLRRLGFEPPYEIPTDSVRAKEVVDLFDQTAVWLRTAVRKEAASYTKDNSMRNAIYRAIERQWSRHCRELGMVALARQSLPEA